MSLKNKRALVTGATSGIGRATADALAREGALVLVSGRDRERGGEVVDGIRDAGGTAELLPGDLATPRGVAAVLDQAGEVDILVNNAGVFPGGPTHEISGAAFDQAFAVNVRAPFFLTAALAPRMAERGTRRIRPAPPAWATASRRSSEPSRWDARPSRKRSPTPSSSSPRTTRAI